MQSIWQSDTQFDKFNKLNKDIKTDVLIIGAGIAGVLCAYELSCRGIDYTLVDAGEICSHTTANTTAKITSQHGLIYNKIEKEFNTDYAHLYFSANQMAISEYKKLSQKYNCDFEFRNNYVYSKDDYSKLNNELKTLDKFTDTADIANNLPIPINTVGAVKFKNQAQFNPLMLLSELSRKLNIYENTKVYKIDGNTAYCEDCKITADKIVVATHFPIIDKYGAYYMKMYQHRSYVLALENGRQIDGMYVDEADDGMSFRNYGNYLLVGGEGKRTGTAECGFSALENFASVNYPGKQIKYKWATQDCITLDGIAYIGKYSKLSDNLYVTTGFNKWGMSTAMVSSKILADLIEGKDNDYAQLYSPSRTMLRPQLALNLANYILDLCTFSKKRCTHLGCALKWNREEHSWDCPCHGSRFDKDGNIIDVPATSKLKNE